MLSFLRLAPVVAISILAGTANAQTYFTAVINGGNEVPPTASTSLGIGMFVLDAAGANLSYNISYTIFDGAETVAHFHQGAAGVNGPVIIPLPIGSPKIGTTPVTPAQAAALLAGNVYFNGHSNIFPGGEIRGQLVRSMGPEVEPNDSKTAANVFVNLPVGNTVSGRSTGGLTNGGLDSVDYYQLNAPAAAPGIYRHTLNLYSPENNFAMSIRGLSQNAGVIDPASDVVLSNAVLNAAGNREISYYDFGTRGRIFVSIAGSTSTNFPYTLRHDVTQVAPIVIGPFTEGAINFAEVGANVMDFDYWVYDTDGNPIPGYGHDDNDAPGMTRPFLPGTYFVAVSRFNFANNLPSPADDAYRTGNVADFPGIALSDAEVNNPPIAATLGVTNQGLTTTVPVNLSTPYEVRWYRFAVIPGCEADFNHDGIIDFFDYLDFVQAFSVGC